MAVLAGASAIAGMMPGERIATDIVTADSSTFTTTETVVQTAVAALITGRIYKVKWFGHWGSSVSGDRFQWRIRETNVSGTVLQELTAQSTAAHGGASLGEQIKIGRASRRERV